MQIIIVTIYQQLSESHRNKTQIEIPVQNSDLDLEYFTKVE